MPKIREKQLDIRGNLSMNDNRLTGLSAPVDGSDAVNKTYADSLSHPINPKDPVRAATAVADGNITLSGLQTVDGISLINNDRVLIKNQTSPKENGIYVVYSAGAWSRSAGADTWGELINALVFVEEGTENVNSYWLCTPDVSGELDVDPLPWVNFLNVVTYTTDGEGLQLIGTELSLELDGDSLQKGASGIKSAVEFKERYDSLTPSPSSPIQDHDTGVTITYTPAGNSDVVVYVNGMEENLSYGDMTGSLYFSADGGSTARDKSDITAGDSLWFSETNAGYPLESDDVISMVYSKVN